MTFQEQINRVADSASRDAIDARAGADVAQLIRDYAEG